MSTLTLTPRQEQIAQAIALGATKKEIANELHISEEKVSNHAKQVYEKTGTHSVGQLSAWWFKKTFNIELDLKPFMIAFFLCLTIANEFNSTDATRARYGRAKVKRGKTDNDFDGCDIDDDDNQSIFKL